MSTELKRYNVERRYSNAAVYNGVVYVAGQVPETTLDGDIAAQTAEVLAIIDRVLAANGSDKTRILMCQIFLKDIAEIGRMNEVWDQWVAPGNAPPRATVEAALAHPGYRIEIVVTAAQKG
ncbi:RidA family protein [Ralstonia syzygii]|uniref:RidA family protein n=1 Tax=Ralstonia syzygii TaxID=28097 RepID=UPI0018D0E8E4|nr:RidA family protein [Ralstonia syzygii]